MLARLLYRDALILVIDKPAGLPVHAGPGGGDNLEQYLDALRFGLPRVPSLAHRLDRDTSGCLVLGRHRKALAKLGRMFESKRVGKTYWAIVEGAPEQDSGTIDLALAKKSERKDRWHMKVDPDGMETVTDYRVRGRGPGIAWIEFNPRTGRTHQLRVHAQAMGWPIVGDQLYGSGGADGTLHLQSRAITLPLYPSRDPVHVEAPPPPHMLERLRQCGWEPT
ncbi:RNA pseudouridine synthase [Rhodospirillales bacterium TMPK1]|uniref:RNA pseudouridine synthase n=2 Tax=Roseiterribacter gracilis TaxID=2812848 RepID=A0A8S8XFY4_9PROT|nr:RNA pseudouridine synthase [Rhodospirillales bacterium TMPK1]